MASRDLKGLTIEIGGNTSKLTSALKDVDSELSNLQSNLRTVNSALKLDPSNVEALAQKQALLTGAVEATTQRLETLREAQAQVDQQIADGVDVDEQAYRSLRSEIIRAEASLTDYQRQLSETDDELSDLSSGTRTASRETDDLADSADDAADSAEDSAEGWTIVKDVIADLASQVIQSAIQAFGDLMLAGEQALDMFQAKTGLSSRAMDNFSKTARDIFKGGWGNELSDVTDTMAEIYNTMGDMDTDHMQKYTENAMTLTDVFGWDTQEQLRAVNALMNQFGVSSDEAFNLMVQGAQLGLDQNGDLLDTINEYSVQFKNAGYSADDMFNMLMNGADEGTWSVDKLGDAVKEYNIRVSDGTVAEALMENRKVLGLTKSDVNALSEAYGKGGEEGKAAMQATLDAVLAVEDETQRYQLGVALFGTMWEDLGQDAITALMDTEGGILATNEAMSQVKTDAYDNLATSITTLGRTLKDELLQPIVDLIAPAIKSVVDWMIENMNIVKPIIIGVATAFGTLASALAISGIISTVQKAMVLLNSTLLANPITLVVAAIGGLVAAFVTAYQNSETFRNIVNAAMEAVWAVVEPIAESIKNALIQAWELAQAVWELCEPYFTTIWNNIQIAAEFLRDTLAAAFQTAWSIIEEVWSVVSGYFQTVWDTIAGIFSVVESVLSGDFSGAWETIQGIVSEWAGYFESVWESIKKVFAGVVAFFRLTFNNGWDAVKDVFSNWSTFFGDLWTTIKDKFSSIGTNIADAISDSVKSGINGVISKIESTINKAVGIINGAIDVINGIPGVDVGKVATVSFPRLARGGVVYEPTLAEIGEYAGASRNPEIVTPQNILRDTFEESLAKFALNQAGASDAVSRSDAQYLATQIGELRTLIAEYLPEIASKAAKNIYLDKRRLIGELASDMDEALGDIANRRAVGAV